MNADFTKERLLRLLDRWYHDSPLKSQWLTCGPTKIYVRKTPVWKDGRFYTAFTIANISMPERLQRKGILTSICEWATEIPEVEVLKIENVINPEFAQKLRELYWKCDEEDPPSFFLWL